MENEKGYWPTFGFRVVTCYILCVILFFVTVLRVTTIAVSDVSTVQTSRNGIRLTLPRQRGTIYDCNGEKLTNQEENIIAAITPTPRAITAIKEAVNENRLKEILEQLKSGKPILCNLPKPVDCEDIICFKTYESTAAPCKHIVGYTNSDNIGQTGLEKAYDEILYCKDEISLYYETDAKGRALEGIKPEITHSEEHTNSGVISTLNSQIQSIAESYAQGIEKGAVVIAEVATGKIRAMVSRPFFDSENIDIYLNSPSSPLLNRALQGYSVGSVFKPCVAIAGLEAEKSFKYKCTGSCEIIDRFFNCHKLDGHGKLNLKKALAFSCNTFFYNYAFKVGAESIYRTAKALSFGQRLNLCDGISASKGNLPEIGDLENIAHLANFSIGQGELLLSPVSILTLYCAIAGDGSYFVPSIVEKTVTENNTASYDIGAATYVMKSSTAATIRNYLKSVLIDGTGEKAKPKYVSAAGKTATAQTGKYDNTTEICSSWFCGFFPAEKPKYVVIVFSEDDRKQSITCSEIFAKIADSITLFEKNKTLSN